MSTQITIFFIAFNAMAGVVMGMGVDEQLGINVETGNPEQLEEITTQDEIDLGNNVGSTLFGMYNVLTDQIGNIFYTLAPGFKMLRVFVPNIWVDLFLSPIASIIVTKDIIGFARGVDV
jgi:hypothetical protein